MRTGKSIGKEARKKGRGEGQIVGETGGGRNLKGES